MMNELENALETLKTVEKIASRVEAKWEKDPENKELEALFDKMYAAEFEYYMKCVKLVRKISRGEISFDTAKRLVVTDRDNLFNVLDKYRFNSMCHGCTCFGKTCSGTMNMTWTGCAFREM